MPHHQFIFFTYVDPKCTLYQLTLKSSHKAFFFPGYIHKVGFTVCVHPNTATKDRTPNKYNFGNCSLLKAIKICNCVSWLRAPNILVLQLLRRSTPANDQTRPSLCKQCWIKFQSSYKLILVIIKIC